MEFHQQPGVMTTAPNPPMPQQGGSRLKSALVLVAVAVVFGGGGALGTDLAMGSPKAAPSPAKTKQPGIPSVFQAMPSPCDLLTTAQVTQFVQHPKQPQVMSKTGEDGNPGGMCEFATSSDFLGHDRTVDVTVDMLPSSAQGSGPDLAKAAFEKKATNDKAKAGTTKKTSYQTTTYAQLTQLPGLGEEAYSLYYSTVDSSSAFGYAETDVLRGNVVFHIQTSGFDEPADGSGKPPALADSDLRPPAEQMARYAVANLNSCTACAGH